jgi:hypothetical protein
MTAGRVWLRGRGCKHPCGHGWQSWTAFRGQWRLVLVLAWWCALVAQSSAGEARGLSNRQAQGKDPCYRLLQQSTTHLRRILDLRLTQGFPISQQLDEGNAHLSPLAVQIIDCEGQRVVVSGTYEFRGNIGVMDITRRGTTVIQLRLKQPIGQRHVLLEKPEVLDITFDNPAPWFDGTAIRNWALALFATPICANFPSGQPC